MDKAFPLLMLAGTAIGGAVAHLMERSILTGMAIGLVLGSSPMLLLGIVYSLLMAWRPDRPICRCGRCRSEHYEFIGPEHASAGSVFEYCCRFCGREYRQKDNRFWEYMRDGSEIPYMRISKWGRWQAENAESSAADLDELRR